MGNGHPLIRPFIALVALMAALSAAPRPAGGAPAQSSGDSPHEGNWNREPEDGGWRVAVQFTNYNGDRLGASFPVARADVEQSGAEFGYFKAEAQAIFDGCASCDQAEYDRRMAEFYRRRGIDAVRSAGHTRLSVDMPELVRRNAPRVRAAAQEIERIARERKYDAGATLGAVLSLAQTGIPYYRPPLVEDGREIIGLYPPPRVLADGRGDCDSKTGLVASLLKNFSGARMIGINIPRHYLMGVARVPQSGEAYLEYGGEQYVLLEPAGPAWLPPGTASDMSLDALGVMQDVRIDPFN